MKKSYFIVFILFCGIGLKAQMLGVPNLTTFDDRRVHFGFTLGINTFDMGFSHYYDLNENPQFNEADVASISQTYLDEIDSVGRMIRADISGLTPGFTVGIVSNLRLTENLDLRFVPGLSFGNRRIVYNVPIHDLSEPTNVDDYSMRSTYLDFPLMVKYKSKRLVNQRPYMIGGMALRYDISKSLDELIRTRKASVYAEVGMGWDVYLQFFRLSTELKYSFGLNNYLNNIDEDSVQPKYYMLAFDRLSSHILTLSFHFE